MVPRAKQLAAQIQAEKKRPAKRAKRSIPQEIEDGEKAPAARRKRVDSSGEALSANWAFLLTADSGFEEIPDARDYELYWFMRREPRILENGSQSRFRVACYNDATRRLEYWTPGQVLNARNKGDSDITMALLRALSAANIIKEGDMEMATAKKKSGRKAASKKATPAKKAAPAKAEKKSAPKAASRISPKSVNKAGEKRSEMLQRLLRENSKEHRSDSQILEMLVKDFPECTSRAVHVAQMRIRMNAAPAKYGVPPARLLARYDDSGKKIPEIGDPAKQNYAKAIAKAAEKADGTPQKRAEKAGGAPSRSKARKKASAPTESAPGAAAEPEKAEKKAPAKKSAEKAPAKKAPPKKSAPKAEKKAAPKKIAKKRPAKRAKKNDGFTAPIAAATPTTQEEEAQEAAE